MGGRPPKRVGEQEQFWLPRHQIRQTRRRTLPKSNLRISTFHEKRMDFRPPVNGRPDAIRRLECLDAPCAKPHACPRKSNKGKKAKASLPQPFKKTECRHDQERLIEALLSNGKTTMPNKRSRPSEIPLLGNLINALPTEYVQTHLDPQDQFSTCDQKALINRTTESFEG